MTYLDHNATTPVDGRVLKVMMPLFAEGFGNPSSSHASGRMAAEVVEDARRKVAGAVGMGASDVIFTSGATEANNLALTGLRAGLRRGVRIFGRRHRAQVRAPDVHQSGRSGLRIWDDAGPARWHHRHGIPGGHDGR